jgi:hypothetical protein
MTENIEKDLEALSLAEKLDLTYYNIENLVTKNHRIWLPKIPDFLDTIENELNINIDKTKLIIRDQKTINLKENMSIQDDIVLRALLTFLGSINKKNDYPQFTSESNSKLINDNIYLENSGFKKHLYDNLQIIFSDFKRKDLRLFTEALSGIGISITATDLYAKIKRYIFERDKILLIIAPSGNFWIKNEKNNINGKQYDKKLNNHSNIFYNWHFVRTFYKKVANHPRCVLGILSSMLSKNIKPCIEFISIDLGQSFTKFLLYDQFAHDNTQKDNKEKPNFVRNLEKIITNSNSNQDWSFNETNIAIVESEVDKMEKTRDNSVVFNSFDESFFGLSDEKKEEVNRKADKFINNLVAMLEECETDVREYLANHEINKI